MVTEPKAEANRALSVTWASIANLAGSLKCLCGI